MTKYYTSIAKTITIVLSMFLCSCNNPEHFILVNAQITSICKKLELGNSSVETKSSMDTRTGKKNELIIKFQKNYSDTLNIYSENPDYLINKVAYDIYSALDSLKFTGDYSSIIVEGSIDGTINKATYPITKFLLIKEIELLADSFLTAAINNDYDKAKSFIDTAAIDDSTLTSTTAAIYCLAKNGLVQSNELIAWKEKTNSSNEVAVIVEKLIRRKNSEEKHTLYFFLPNKKIIIMGIASTVSLDC